MVASRLTSKYQATVPAEVRRALGLRQGDLIEFRISRGRVTLARAEPPDREYLRSLQTTLTEWDSRFDDEAYGDL